ncbi:hypothetical protein ACTA71_006352 [Dictyostelium dimigraforme]
MKTYYLLLIFLIFILNREIRSDNLIFIGSIEVLDNSFFNESLWSPNYVPTYSDSLLIGNGANCWIYPYETAIVNSLKLTNGSVLFLLGHFGILQTLELNNGDILMAYRSVLLVESISIESSTLNIRNYITHSNDFDHDAIIKDSNITIAYDGTLLISNNSTFTLDNSSLTIINNGYVGSGMDTRFYLSYPLILTDNGLMESIGGIIWINKFDSYLNSEFSMFNSNITFFENVNFNGFSRISFLNSNVFAIGDLNSNDNSTTIVSGGGNFLLSGDYKLRNGSKFFVNGEDTVVFVKGEFSNHDESIFYLNQSQFLVYGHASFGSQSYFDSGLFIVNNLVIWDGWVLGNYTNFVVNGSLIINTSYASMVSSKIISVGDITINGILTTTDSLLYVDQGNFIVNNFAILQLIGSEARINNGQLRIHPLAYLDIQNSSFTLVSGNVDTLGNVYLDSSSGLTNRNGTYNLYSGIYYTNDTSIKTNYVTVSNDGIFNVVNKSVEINVAFTNSGSGGGGGGGSSGSNSSIAQLNINNNTLFIYDFKNENGGEITLNGGTLSSDNSIQFNGGIIKGNGSFNTSINQSNGQFGSKSTVNNFNITGNFIQSSNNNSTIIIIIDSLDSFSTLNIGQLADINGIIEIRINQDIFNNNNNNNDNLESNLSQSSSNNGNGITSTTFNLINYNNKTSNSFSNIQFKTYDPKSGSESDINKDSCIQPKAKSGSSSFSVLLEQNESCGSNSGSGSGKNKLSGGAIAGIVIGCCVAVIIIISAIHYRERIRLLKVNTSRKLSNMSVKLTKK